MYHNYFILYHALGIDCRSKFYNQIYTSIIIFKNYYITKFIYRYNKKTDKLEISTAVFNKKDISIIGMRIVYFFRLFMIFNLI